MVFGFGSSSGSSTSSSTNSSTPLPAEAPNREQRAACWTARDAYFACLDKNGVVQAGEEGEGGRFARGRRRGMKGLVGGAGKERSVQGEGLWGQKGQTIEYFNKRRTLELRQRATVEAAAKAREANPANAGR
ncbi:hypothetical protein EHS25_008112 [Saitozyma podzolica]|uniref:Uncharacterized protein n=1 Tax=Saitozyma podzolica TaxID=1890683 RepID=A0A427YNN1_9TREE|nr:hypothetical protein EHS25_008112 [Saitozyma podzolica]